MEYIVEPQNDDKELNMCYCCCNGGGEMNCACNGTEGLITTRKCRLKKIIFFTDNKADNE